MPRIAEGVGNEAQAVALEGSVPRSLEARRRNGIVHASWYKDRDADEWCGHLVPSSIDQISEILSRDPANQKIRARHLFRPSDM